MYPRYLTFCQTAYLPTEVIVAKYSAEKALAMDEEPQRPSTLQNVRIGSKRSLGVLIPRDFVLSK